MIVKLNFTNALPVPVEAGQALQMTFQLEDGEDGVGDLVLICEPGEARR